MIRLDNETGSLIYELIQLAIRGRDRLPEPMRSWDWETIRQSILEQREAPEHAADLVDVISNYLMNGSVRGGIQGDSLRKFQRAILLPSELAQLKRAGQGGPACATCQRELRHFELVAVTEDNRLICSLCDLPQMIPLSGHCHAHRNRVKVEELSKKAFRAIRDQIKTHEGKGCPACEQELAQMRADAANGVQPVGPQVIQLPNPPQEEGATITVTSARIPSGASPMYVGEAVDGGPGPEVQVGTASFRLRDDGDARAGRLQEVVRSVEAPSIPGDPSPFRSPPREDDDPTVASARDGVWPDLSEGSNQTTQAGAAGGTASIGSGSANGGLSSDNPFGRVASRVWDGIARPLSSVPPTTRPRDPRPRNMRISEAGMSLGEMLEQRSRRERQELQQRESNEIMRRMRESIRFTPNTTTEPTSGT